MDMKPVDSVMAASTPVRMPDKLEVKEDGTVQAQPTTDKVEIKKKKKVKDGFLANTAKTILSGVGLGSGVVGGGIIGAGLGASGSLISGLAGSGLTWASLGTGGMIGGIAGAVIFGAAGTYGGWTFASALIKTGRFFNKLLFTKEPLSEAQQAALDRIKEVEDNPKEATKALEFISKNLASDEKLDQETDLYIGLLNHFSNKKSNEALSAYTTLKERIAPGENRSAAVSELGKFSGVFKTPEDSMDALFGVMENMKAKDSISGECDKLRAAASYLKACTPEHADITPDVAAQAYLAIKNRFAPEEQKAVLDATLGQFSGKKFEPEDAMKTLKTIIDNRAKGDDLGAETRNLMGLNERLGSEDASKLYVKSKTYLPPGDVRNQLIPQFDRLSGVFGNAKEAQSALLNVLGSLNKSDSFDGEVGALKKVVDALKSCSASDAHIAPDVASQAYSLVKSGFAPGERDAAIDATLGQFGKMSPADALKNMGILLSCRNKGDDLKAETKSFNTLLEKFGGNSTVTCNFYAATKKYLPPGEERGKALTEYDNFVKTFGSGDQAMEALYMVLKSLNKSDSLSTEAARLRDTVDSINACSSGNVTPGAAGEIYQSVKQQFAPKEREEALKDTFGVFASEGKLKPADAVADFKTLIATRKNGENLGAEAKTLLDITGKMGGNADVGRKAYTMLKEGFAPDGRDAARSSLLDLKELEKSPDNALASFAGLNKNLFKGESLAEAVKDFTTIYNLCQSSSSAHEVALSVQQWVSKTFEKGTGRETAIGAFGNLVSAGAKSAADDLNFVYTHTGNGESFGDEVNKYIGFLKSNSNNSNAAREAYTNSKFKELWGT